MHRRQVVAPAVVHFMQQTNRKSAQKKLASTFKFDASSQLRWSSVKGLIIKTES